MGWFRLVIVFLLLYSTHCEEGEVADNNATSNSNASSSVSASSLSTPALSPSSSSSTAAPTPAPKEGAAEQEHSSSMAIFFGLCVLGVCILSIHVMIQTNLQYLPESIVVIFLGALIGLTLKLLSDSGGSNGFRNWEKEEALSPTAFFLVLLPPIIFESGYNLHKGNFFQNIGSISVFAVIGTVINALVFGAGVFLLGVAEVTYPLTFTQSFAFGSLISAVDPVATLAIFTALDVDPVLKMLVFGESILNDAVAIVLTSTILQLEDNPSALLSGLKNFLFLFFTSSAIGLVFALTSALLLKHIDLRKNPSLEFGMMLVFTYGPYALAEGVHLSGIMAILFCGIGMSHYTHFNLSPVTQITMQQTMRTLAFIAETCVFAYLGLAIFSSPHRIEMALIVWSLLLCLVGRALNIFPLGSLVNRFRAHRITGKMMFVMWFSGLRGAIAYALSLHLEFENKDTRQVIITTTLIIVLFTTLVFGGLTMPIVKYVQGNSSSRRRRRSRRSSSSRLLFRERENGISLSKTKEMGQTIDSEHLSELTTEEEGGSGGGGGDWGSGENVFLRLDAKYFRPFFTRRFTQQELRDCQSQMTDLTNRWYQNVRVSPLNTEDEDEEEEVEFVIQMGNGGSASGASSLVEEGRSSSRERRPQQTGER